VLSYLKLNWCYGFAAVAFTCFGVLGLILHKTVTGVAAWGAIPWLFAIMAGSIPMSIWSLVAIVRGPSPGARRVSVLLAVAALFAPAWILFEIVAGR